MWKLRISCSPVASTLATICLRSFRSQYSRFSLCMHQYTTIFEENKGYKISTCGFTEKKVSVIIITGAMFSAMPFFFFTFFFLNTRSFYDRCGKNVVTVCILALAVKTIIESCQVFSLEMGIGSRVIGPAHHHLISDGLWMQRFFDRVMNYTAVSLILPESEKGASKKAADRGRKISAILWHYKHCIFQRRRWEISAPKSQTQCFSRRV